MSSPSLPDLPEQSLDVIQDGVEWSYRRLMVMNVIYALAHGIDVPAEGIDRAFAAEG